METDDHDTTGDGGDGGGSETKAMAPNDKGVVEMEESAAKSEDNGVNEPGEALHSDKNDESTAAGGESEMESLPSATFKEVTPELTLVLIGDINSIEIGSENILPDHNEQAKMKQFSPKLYDLCGRHISVINMLGQQNVDKFPLNKAIHAFLLLLPNGLHSNHYSAGVQWLEKTFGKGSLAYLVPVVTYESGEDCESALTELKANSNFSEKRYQTCSRSMMNETEVISLLEKIDIMVSENSPRCHTGLMCDRNKEQNEHLDHKSHEEERISSSEFLQSQADELEESTTKAKSTKCDSVNESGDSEDSEKNDNTGAESQSQSEPFSPEEKSTFDMDMSGDKDKHSTKIPEINREKKKKEEETKTLFGRLHLQDKQQKFSPADFLKIGPPVKQDHDTCEKDVAHTFLQRLMMLDYRARYVLVRQDSPKVSHSKPVPISDTDDDDLDALFSTSVNSDQSEQTRVHPMDVQMAAFHCSDSFFKQNMITKLSQCQYALPLLVPNPFTMEIDCPLWTFRQIRKTWKITQTKDNQNIVTMKSLPICKAETPLVVFFRLGSLSVSKSQLMNTLINNRHSIFFHRNCPGSTKCRHLMDGVAEIAWYCPSGKPNDAFTDCIAFCNLHGDSLLLEKQHGILTEKSSINVVLVPTLEKSQKSTTVISSLFRSPKPLIILIADNDCGAIQMKEGKYKMGLKDRSQSDVSEELKGIIGNLLCRPHTTFQLETMAEVSGINVDEDDPVCQKGKLAAMETVNLLQGMDVSKIKDRFLPCQGQLWHDWCRTKKELYHLKGNIEKEKCKKENQLTQIRQNQRTASCSELMKLFIKSLSSLTSTDKEYFLKWAQILIDALSTDDLSLILQSYDEKWSEVLTLKKKHDKSDLLKTKQRELDQISTKLQSATFGLEHIFREMGQIYEAHATLQKQQGMEQTNWLKYPELAAELMISGHPMELMDGDAGQVPLVWISSLLDEVINKLGDKKVFVLSVLGVQSSGKSTMLNAMFGLQFAVSAGRCTKGAFMQLVKVSEEIKKDFCFDYILVVDTEGLHALELAGNASLHHDNELATFVVGLGNMTLINIFGENPAEMQDVLQIVVQAFMRMKKVKLSPSCVFVHQNVTDIAAAEKNMDGKRRLQEKLDQMAKLAAKEEVCDAECFSDVIAFDVQRDVKYFAQLWEGSPPMAPPNPGYSESIQELKNFILSKASKSVGITLSQFKSKIQDLWNALMNENFVFSFKNTLEIAVYRKLEVQYGNWTWTLRSKMLTIENELHTEIENRKLDKVEKNDLYEKMRETYRQIKKEMTIHFDDNREKEILVQWRSRFENKIKEFHDEQVSGIKRKLDEVIQQKNACKKLDDKKSEFEKKLLQKSKELSHELKDKAKNEEELQKQFNSVWSGWVSELTADTKPIEDINLKKDQIFILQELGIEWSVINDSKLSGRYKNISTVGSYLNYISIKKHQDLSDESQQSQHRKQDNEDTGTQRPFSVSAAINHFQKLFEGPPRAQRGRCPLPYEQQQLIRSFINDVEQQSLNAIKTKPVTTRGYSLTYLQEVAKSIQTRVTIFESERKYTLKKEFMVDLLLYVFDSAGSWLSESHKKFQTNNDALTYLESKKTQYYNIFRSLYKGSTSAVVLGELICAKLMSSTVEAACNKTAIDIANEMRCSFPAFSENRLNLEKRAEVTG